MKRGAYSILTKSRDELYQQCGITKVPPRPVGYDLYEDFTWDHFKGDTTDGFISCDKFPLKKYLKYIDLVDAQDNRNKREMNIEGVLTSWDRDFIASMRVKTLGDMSKNWLSRKQYDTLGRIHGKVIRHDAMSGLRRTLGKT